MPELPEVETICRGLASTLEGRRLTKVIARRPDLRFPLPQDFAQRLTGQRITKLSRRAKYILAECDSGLVLLVHLGMSGRLFINTGLPPRNEKHDHITFTTDLGIEIVFNDARRFGMMDLIEAGEIQNHKLLKGLGPEPLGNHFNAKSLSESLKGRRTPIKSALLDQRIIAGLGNIYVSEALFRAGISPLRQAHSVAGARADRLVPAIRDVLNDAIAAGGSSLRDYVQASGEGGYFQHAFRVYDRANEPCMGCTGPCRIQRITQAGRSTYYCPTKQR